MTIDDGYTNLAQAIIAQAIPDGRHGHHHPGVLAFAQSEWFEILCDAAGLDPDATRRYAYMTPKQVARRKLKYETVDK